MKNNKIANLILFVIVSIILLGSGRAFIEYNDYIIFGYTLITLGIMCSLFSILYLFLKD